MNRLPQHPSENFLWGVDLGGTKIEAVILDKKEPGVALYRRRIPTEGMGGYDHVLGQVVKLTRKFHSFLLRKPGSSMDAVLGLNLDSDNTTGREAVG